MSKLFFSVCCGLELPNFYERVRLPAESDVDEKKKLEAEAELKPGPEAARPKSEIRVLVPGFFFFVLCGGVDAYFQSQTYTFGLCGPLSLTPAQVCKHV
jgi:hypothetical protein